MLKISIVIPTRNRAIYLKHCIETCLSSNDPDIEVIVSDNNSVDQTQSVVASFSDTRLHYYHTGVDLSMRQNFEFALDKATGDYIFFIGDDEGLNLGAAGSLGEFLADGLGDFVDGAVDVGFGSPREVDDREFVHDFLHGVP